MFPKIRKKRVLKSYVGELPELLKKDYGRCRDCTVEQVSGSLKRHNFNREYAIYAYAIFSSRDAFNESFPENGTKYESLRKEIADNYFNGNMDFNADYSSLGESAGDLSDGSGD